MTLAAAPPLTPDLCILGAGAGALALATAAAAMGVPVVLIEPLAMGADRSLPVHALIAAARAAHAVRTSARFGVTASEPRIVWLNVRARIREVVAAVAPNGAQARLEAMNVRVIRAAAHFVSPTRIEAGGVAVEARRFVIAPEAEPAAPIAPGLEGLSCLSEATLLAQDVLPRRLIILGGAPRAAELAQAMARLGVGVELVEPARLLPGEDPHQAAIVADALTRDGVVLHEDAHVTHAQTTPEGGVSLLIEGSMGALTLDASQVLAAAGLRAPIDDLGLKAAGVAFTAQGVLVDAGLRTTNRRVYALTAASREAAVRQAGLVLRSALLRLPVRDDATRTPRLTATDPELAAVGLTEAEARARYGFVRVLRWPFAATDRAQADGDGRGHVMLVVARGGRILGASIVGAQAGELIALWGLAITRKQRLSAIAGLAMPYPVLAAASQQAAMEAYMGLLRNPWLGRALGLLRRLG